MALALYRKYRPRTFAEVIGQEHVTEPLSQALRTGRLHHAYLFSGPRGCGKTSSARILARSLNCEKGPTPDPCGECDSCRSLASDGPGSIDVIEIDAASHGGVDDARDLRERAFFAPVSSRYKIYVIDEAHMVSSAGFNALLKLVEEPPEYVKFVFATTEPEKVLGTIKSRTHHYPFRLIPPGVLRPYLEELCGREAVTVEPAVFPLVVRAGGGSARDSLSVLDQLIAGAGDEGVTYARAAALLGVTDVALIDEMCDAIGAGDGAAAFATIDRVAEAGHDPRRFASDLLDRFRDLIILQQVPDAVAKGLLDAPTDQLERMALQAQHMGPAALSRCADIVHNGLVEMRGTTAPRLLLELVTARMLLPAADESDGGLLHRLERMERRVGMGGHGEAEAPPPIPDRRVREAAPSRPDDTTDRGVRGAAPAGPDDATDRGVRGAAPDSALDAEVGEDPGPARPSRTAAGKGRPARPAAGSERSARTAAGPEHSAEQAAGPELSARTAAGPERPGQEASGPERSGRTAAEPRRPGAGPERTAPTPQRPGEQAAGSEQAAASPARSSGADAATPEPPDRTAAAPARAAQPGARAQDPAPQQGGVTTTLDGAAVRRVWGEVLTMVGRKSKKVAAWVREATVRDVEGETIVLVFRYPFHAEALSASPEILVDALYEVLGGRWRIRCEVGGDQREKAPRPAPAPRTAAPVERSTADTTDWPTPAKPGGPAQRGTPDMEPEPDEPPFDPDYDAVVDEPTARRTSEQQALQLLQETLGAEKIGEVDHR